MSKDVIAKGISAYQAASPRLHQTGMKKSGFTNEKKAWDVAQKMETMCAGKFIQQLFSANKSGLFGGGHTETMFRSFFTENIAAQAPLNLGIAESIYPVLLKNQGEDR